jgi:hypothetical protein
MTDTTAEACEAAAARVEANWDHRDATLIRALVAERDRLREAALRAERFIVNGVGLGFIRMPDHDTPDTAHEALPFIRAALGANSHE